MVYYRTRKYERYAAIASISSRPLSSFNRVAEHEACSENSLCVHLENLLFFFFILFYSSNLRSSNCTQKIAAKSASLK